MKCPYCEYENGWSGEKLEIVRGEHGEFFSLSNNIEMKRHGFYGPEETRGVLGCPSCNKIFMSDDR